MPGAVVPAAMRPAYALGHLHAADLAATPLDQFRAWLADAVEAGLREPNGMVLSTADAHGRPSSRSVLLKGVDERGFVLFTNHGSRKGREMLANPWASLVFPWFEIDRQVVVVGRVEVVDRLETEAYFRTRPYGSQLGAWASEQSTVLPDRVVLDERWAELARRFPEGTEVPVPDRWGGFRVVPETVEFWQGRASRLHDRLRYRRPAAADDGAGWVLERLAP